MAAEHDVIDLDVAAEPATRGGLAFARDAARSKTALRLAAVFAAGLLLGGTGVSVLRDRQEQQERDAAVHLVATPETANLGGSGTGRQVRLQGRLAVLNVGQAPVTIRGVRADRPDVTVSSFGQPQVAQPAGTVRLLVQLRFDCPVVLDPTPLPVVFAVTTADRQAREFRFEVQLVDSAWATDARGMCMPLPVP